MKAKVAQINQWPTPGVSMVKPGLYSSRWLSLTVVRLSDSRRQSHVCLYFSWRLSPAQVGDCRQQLPTVVFKVQQCWTFNAVARSRWHFPSNQRATTAFNKAMTNAHLQNIVIKHLKLQSYICHRLSDYKNYRKEISWKNIGEKIERVVSIGQPVYLLSYLYCANPITCCQVCAIQEAHMMLFRRVNTSQLRNLNLNLNSHLNLNSVDGSFCRSVGRLFILAEDLTAFGRQLAMTPVVAFSSDKTVGDCHRQLETEV